MVILPRVNLSIIIDVVNWLKSSTKLILQMVISSKLADWLVILQTRYSATTERDFPTQKAPLYDVINL
jgi:hypothetical protein